MKRSFMRCCLLFLLFSSPTILVCMTTLKDWFGKRTESFSYLSPIVHTLVENKNLLVWKCDSQCFIVDKKNNKIRHIGLNPSYGNFCHRLLSEKGLTDKTQHPHYSKKIQKTVLQKSKNDRFLQINDSKITGQYETYHDGTEIKAYISGSIFPFSEIAYSIEKHKTGYLWSISKKKEGKIEHRINNLKEENEVDSNTTYETTSLYSACGNGDLPEVEKYLKEKAEVNTHGQFGRLPLCIAVTKEGNEKIIEMLLKAGADPELQEKLHHSIKEKNALEIAKELGYEEISKLLLKYCKNKK